MIIPSEIWEQAAGRWRRRTLEREKQRADAEGRPRPQLRVRRLTRAAAQEKARALALAAGRTGKPSATAVDEFALERILGKSDLLDANFLELAIAMARPVARVRVTGGFGTGFLVSPSLLLTNHHVIGDASEGASAEAEFDYQQNRTGELLPVQSFALEPQRFFLSSEPLDFTLIAVAPESNRGVELERYGWVKMIADQGKADAGDCVNIVQHPRGGLKQIALRENEVVDIFDDFLHYRTDTEPGSSGSPCFNDQWELIALHHSGVPKSDPAGRLLQDDGSIWRSGIDPPTRLAWVANEGVRVSSLVRAIEAARMKPEEERLIEELLRATPPNPIELARGGSPLADTTSTTSVAVGANSITWTLPVQVTVTLGTAAATGTATPQRTLAAATVPGAGLVSAAVSGIAARAVAAGGGTSEAPADDQEEKVTIDPNYGNRSGYDPEFLPAFRVPLPTLTASLMTNAATVANGPAAKRHLLDYEHFSLVINKRRRIAFFTAVNIDGIQQQSIGKREKDQWFYDPRIDKAFQIGGEAYAGNVLDQGHLVRRLDPVWGASLQIARRANNDSFHFTNCSPQHKTFNRGGDLWQGLENYLLDKAQNQHCKLTVFTGPVLRPTDPTYQNERMDKPIRIPLEFWKVAALVKPDGKKAAAGFIVTQADLIGDASDLEEKFEPRTFQVPIAQIEKRTGLRFNSLKDFDTAKAGGALERFEELEAEVVPLAGFDDIRL